jgi:hypothetical protein
MEENELLAMSDFSNFHRFIFEGKVEQVQRFVESNPNEKVVIYDDSSAIALTLKCSTFEMYELLVANGFKLAPSENLTSIMDDIEMNPKVKSEMKLKLKEIIRKYMMETTKKHLFKLNLMAKLAPTTPKDKREDFEKVIAFTFEKLAKNPDFEKIMKYVASARGESSDFIDESSVFRVTNFRLANLLRLRR